MLVKKMFFNNSEYEWTRSVPETITIAKGSKITILSWNNNRAGGIYGSCFNDVYLEKNATLKALAYYKNYTIFESTGASINPTYSAKDVYLVTGKVNDLWNDNNNIDFIAAIDAKIVSGGVKALYRLCSKLFIALRRAVIA